MQGLEIQRSVREAWLRLGGKILSDPAELHRRLARRRSKSLTRPPRAWCIAIRASDRRITPAHWVISPEHAMDLDHPEHPYKPIEHEVTIQTHAIRRYCHPVSFSREDAADVAEMLGTSPATLWHARRRGLFDERFIPHLGGKPGRPVPLLYPKGQMFDPGFGRNYAAPHPLWGADWQFLSHLFPDDFEQTLLRRPHFVRINQRSQHPDDPPDFWGWRWICPACRKAVKSIYSPIPIRMIFDNGITIPALHAFPDPVLQKKLCDADLPPLPPPTFACLECHNIRYLPATSPDRAWNQYVGYISGGLLYGHEVPPPADLVPRRQHTRIRQLNRSAPLRRKVLARLSNGWSPKQIADHLGLSPKNVRAHIYLLCRDENVPNVSALAKKLNFAKTPPPNPSQLARARRPTIQQMLLANYTSKQIAATLAITPSSLRHDIAAIYRAHGIKLAGFDRAKRALAQKLRLPYLTRADQLQIIVPKLRKKGLTWKQIAQKTGASPRMAWRYGPNPTNLKPPPAPHSTTPCISSLAPVLGGEGRVRGSA